jgi:N utilization substance protein B
MSVAAPLGAGRREARERIIHLLYEADQRNVSVDEVLADQVLDPDEYTVAVLRGLEVERATIGGLLDAHSKGWPLDRMPHMDRLVLEVGAYELGHRPDVPTAVVLNEAVELANTYGTDDSGRFVNGVLSAVAEELRPATA